MASGIYNGGKLAFVDGTIVWGSSDVRVALVTASYTPDPDHSYVSALTNELSGGGYSRIALAGEVGPTRDDANDRVTFDASDAVFPALGGAAGTPQYAIVYKHNALDAAAELLAWFDLGGTPDVPNGTDYTIQWPAPMFYQE